MHGQGVHLLGVALLELDALLSLQVPQPPRLVEAR